MARSQNAAFRGRVPGDGDPPGESIARKLRAELAGRGWELGEIDNWRDSGWLLPCRRAGQELELVIAGGGASADEWLL